VNSHSVWVRFDVWAQTRAHARREVTRALKQIQKPGLIREGVVYDEDPPLIVPEKEKSIWRKPTSRNSR